MTDEKYDDLMGGSGIPTCSFLTKGAAHEGFVVSYEKSQQRIFGTSELATWDDGSPKWQWVFTLQTDEHDEAIEDDDGRRRLFAKAQMLNAIRDAIRKSGHKGDVVGGQLGVKYVEDGEKKTAGMAPKVYAAKFAPPVQTDDFEDGSEPF